MLQVLHQKAIYGFELLKEYVYSHTFYGFTQNAAVKVLLIEQFNFMIVPIFNYLLQLF